MGVESLERTLFARCTCAARSGLCAKLGTVKEYKLARERLCGLIHFAL